MFSGDVDEATEAVTAAAARQTCKTARVRTVATIVPTVGGLHLATSQTLSTQEISHHGPLSVRRNVPTARTQATRIVHGVPVVQAAIFLQDSRVACVDVR